MLVPDVNVLLYAYFQESPAHELARDWIDAALLGKEIVGTPDVVLSGFIRIGTNSALFSEPATTAEAFSAVERFHLPPNGFRLHPAPRHWAVFRELVVGSGAGSKDISDAYLAAFAIENDATFVTFDRGFAKFPGLKVFNPAD